MPPWFYLAIQSPSSRLSSSSSFQLYYCIHWFRHSRIRSFPSFDLLRSLIIPSYQYQDLLPITPLFPICIDAHWLVLLFDAPRRKGAFYLSLRLDARHFLWLMRCLLGLMLGIFFGSFAVYLAWCSVFPLAHTLFSFSMKFQCCFCFAQSAPRFKVVSFSYAWL